MIMPDFNVWADVIIERINSLNELKGSAFLCNSRQINLIDEIEEELYASVTGHLITIFKQGQALGRRQAEESLKSIKSGEE